MAQDPRAPQPVGSAPAWGIAGIILGLGPLLLFGVAAAANLGGPLISVAVFGLPVVVTTVFAVLVTSSPRDHRCVGKAEQLLIESGRDRDATASDEVGLRRLDSAAVLSTIRDVELIASPSGGTDTHAKPRLAHGSGMPDDTASSDSTISLTQQTFGGSKGHRVFGCGSTTRTTGSRLGTGTLAVVKSTIAAQYCVFCGRLWALWKT